MRRQASEAVSVNSAATSVDQSTIQGSGVGDNTRDLLGEVGRDDENQFFSKSWSEKLEEATFGVLFAMCKHSTASRKLSILGIFIDFFQLLAFVMSKQFGWSPMLLPLQRFLSLFGVTKSSNPYGWYMFTLWASMTAITGAVVNIVLVAINFGRSEFSTGSIWMIKTLQTMVSLFLTVLYLPFMTVLLSLVHCVRDPITDKIVMASILDQEVVCWTMPHLAYVVISAPLFLSFLFVSLSFVAVYYDSNPESDHIMARLHARVDLASLILKTLIVACFVFLSNRQWVLILILAAWALTTYSLTWFFMPYYRKSVNMLRCRLFFIIFYGVACLVANVFVTGTAKDIVALLFMLGALPAGYLGGYLAEKRAATLFEIYCANYTIVMNAPVQRASRLRATAVIVQPQVQESLRINIKPSYWNRFMTYLSIATDIPLISKMVCDPIEKKKKRQESYQRDLLEKCDLIYSDGIEQNPESYLLQMCYINFLFFMSKQIDKFRVQAKQLNDLSPPFDVRFMVYRRNKELFQQKQSDSVGSTTMDLVSYIEFQTNYKAARKYHANALRSIRQFWTLLLAEDKFDIELLPRAAKHITEATASAQHHYETLLRRHSDSPRLYRAYAEFLVGTSHDTRKANIFLKKADELEDQMTRKRTEERQRTGLAQNIGDSIDMDDKTKAIITINSAGIVQSVNHTVTKLLQFSKNEIMGMNVSMIMPSPYSENHNTYLDNYLRTGVKKVIGQIRTLDAKKKNGELFPVRLAVHQADVNGQMFFVGVVEKQEDTANVLSVALDGSILSCNQLIAQKIGFTVKELTGQNFGYFFSDSADCSPTVINFDSAFGTVESARLWARHGSGRNVEVVMNPKKVIKDNTAYYRCTFEFLDEIEVMLSIDEEGKIQSCNHFVKHVFGYSRDELIGHDVTVLMPQPYHYFHASYLKNYLLTGNKNVIGMNRTVEGQHKDGTSFKINLLVSEGEVGGRKMFSSRIVFSKRTEITSCRLTLTEVGVIHSHSENTNKIFGDDPLLGVSFERLCAFTSPELDSIDFMEAVKRRCGLSPTNCLILDRQSDVSGTIACAVDFMEQELNGVIYYIVKLSSVASADGLVYCNPLGIIQRFNDIFYYLVAHPKATLNKMKLIDFFSNADTDEAEKDVSPDTKPQKLELAKLLNNRISLYVKHNDGSFVPVFVECCTTTFPLGFACRIVRKVTPTPSKLNPTRPNIGILIDSADNSVASSSRYDSPRDAFGDKEVELLVPAPITLPPKPKKRVQIGLSDPNVEEVDVAPSESRVSDDVSESITSDAHQTVRRIQRIRQKYQQNSGESPILNLLQKRVSIVMGALSLMSLSLLVSIIILSEKNRVSTLANGLCGASVSYHNSIYINVHSLTANCPKDIECPWLDMNTLDRIHDDANMLEQSLMSLYLLNKIHKLYENVKDYTYYSAALPAFTSVPIQKPGVADIQEDNIHSKLIYVTDKFHKSTTRSKRTFLEAMKTYIFYARKVSNNETWPLTTNDRTAYYIVENGPNVLLSHMQDVCKSFFLSSTWNQKVISYLQGFIMVLAVLIIFILALAILRPSFDSVHEERRRALSLFLLVPKSVVRILARTRISLDTSDSDSGDSDNEEPQEKQIDRDKSMENGVAQKSFAIRRQSNTKYKEQEGGSMPAKPSSKVERNQAKSSILRNLHVTIKNRMKKYKNGENQSSLENARYGADASGSGRSSSDRKKLDEVLEDGPLVEDESEGFFSELFGRFKSFLLSVTVDLHPVTKRWVTLLIVLFLWFTCATAYGILTSNKSVVANEHIYYSGKLVAAGQDLSYSSLIYLTGNATLEEKERLDSSMRRFISLLNCVVYGCSSLGLDRADVEKDLSNLYYTQRCFLVNQVECPPEDDSLHELSTSGLVNVANEIARSVDSLLEDSLSRANNFDSPDFNVIYRGEAILLRKGLLMASYIHENYFETNTKSLVFGQGLILGTTIGFIMMSMFLVFRPMFISLQEENRQTKSMLLMMPDEVVANTKEIERFLIQSCENDDSAE